MKENIETFPTFAELGLSTDLCSILKTLGYEAPTAVQAKSIPILLSGRDLIGQAQTGTGKTAAFALPLMDKIDFKKSSTQILVLTPTRELAIQVAEAFKSYAGKSKSFHVLPIYGGQSISTQLHQLNRKPQVIVGTPGRVMDHLRRKTLSIKNLAALVIDEADEMLSMGFIDDIQWIMEQSPVEKQTALFSATMPKPIRNIAQTYLVNPEEVVIKQVASVAQLITQSHWLVSGLHKLDALTRILEVTDPDGMLIFARTKTATLELAGKLEARGYSSGALNGDMSQDARERTVQRFKNRNLDVLVATDVAARGLDIERISHVINYDVPFDVQTYTHRIGRTGRAGREGCAISFVSPREKGLLKTIERVTGNKIPPFQMPTKEEMVNRRLEKLVEKIQEAFTNPDLGTYSKIMEKLVKKTEASAGKVASALCLILHGESPHLAEVAAPSERLDREPSHGKDARNKHDSNRKGKWRRSSGKSSKHGDNRHFGRSSPKGKRERERSKRR